MGIKSRQNVNLHETMPTNVAATFNNKMTKSTSKKMVRHGTGTLNICFVLAITSCAFVRTGNLNSPK